MSLGLRQELVGLCAVGRHPGDLATCQHLVDHGGGETWAHVCPAGAVAFTARATWGRALTVATKPASSPSQVTGSTRVRFTSRPRRALASAAAAVMSRREGDPTSSTSRSRGAEPASPTYRAAQDP